MSTIKFADICAGNVNKIDRLPEDTPACIILMLAEYKSRVFALHNSEYLSLIPSEALIEELARREVEDFLRKEQMEAAAAKAGLPPLDS